MILLLLFACGAAVEKEACESLCDNLYQTCEYGAFPSYDSCLQGCVYQQSEGADITGELTCVERAACDTFAILECEHKFGAAAEEQ